MTCIINSKIIFLCLPCHLDERYREILRKGRFRFLCHMPMCTVRSFLQWGRSDLADPMEDPRPCLPLRTKIAQSQSLANSALTEQKSPEIPQKEGVLGEEIAARNRRSLATFHRTLKSQCSIAFSVLGNHAISGVRDGHRNRKSQKSLRFRCASVVY